VGSVDLIYLDPPFNSNATYNILFAEKGGEKSAAQITAFEDTWHWGPEAMAAYDDAMKLGVPRLADLLQALRAFLGQNDMMAYLTMMAVRLVELHRVLKPTGSLYLHCDPTASHYIKLRPLRKSRTCHSEEAERPKNLITTSKSEILRYAQDDNMAFRRGLKLGMKGWKARIRTRKRGYALSVTP
jgi:DNA modification methylase